MREDPCRRQWVDRVCAFWQNGKHHCEMPKKHANGHICRCGTELR